MDKVLKVLVVLVLVLSAVALTFEVVLFRQREELKGRNQMLARYTTQIAKTLEVVPAETNVDLATRDLPRLQVSEEQLKPFYQRDAAGKIVKDATGAKVTTGANTMDDALKGVLAKAELQYSRLNDTRTGLEQTRTTLADTSNTLVKTEGDLAQTKDTLKKTSDDLDSAKQDIERKKSSIEELTQKNEACAAKSEKQIAEIGKLTDKLSDRETQLDATKRFVEKLQKELVICQGGGETNAPPPGLQGQIILVNTNWNFVVVDILPPPAKVIPMTDLTIQRKDKLVGKVRVSEVIADHNFAVGEILPDWQQTPPKKGDYVFY